jgi:hypothetical protein
MLPKCSRNHRLKAVEKAHAEQTQVNSHFGPAPPKPEKQAPYSDELFNEVAIQWLIETDQAGFSQFLVSSCSLLMPTACSSI